MEDAFLELYQEFKKLQVICSKQAELLQKLLSKKGHTSGKTVIPLRDIVFSLFDSNH